MKGLKKGNVFTKDIVLTVHINLLFCASQSVKW
jgi:hypothetical protein